MTQNPPNPDVSFVRGEDSIALDISDLIPQDGDVLTWSTDHWTSQAPAAGVTLPIAESDVTSLTTHLAAKAPIASPTFTGVAAAPVFSTSGLTGATAATRHVGATASGAPASGTFAVGDFVIDQSGSVWVCTVAGSPGTWAQPTPTLESTATNIKPSGSASAGVSSSVARADHAHSIHGKAYALSTRPYLP